MSESVLISNVMVRDFVSEMEDSCHLSLTVLLWQCWRDTGLLRDSSYGGSMKHVEGVSVILKLIQWCMTHSAAGLSVENLMCPWPFGNLSVKLHVALVGSHQFLCFCVNKKEIK